MIGIQVDNLKKKLGTNQALAGIDINFASGLLHGLIGPEGAGKTTLLRTLLDLLHPDSGTITYTKNGENTSFKSLRASMAYMPQQQSLYPDLSVSEHLDFFKDLYRLPEETYRKKRQELLQLTRLEPFQDRPAGKLSGGMYKKLGLMCALLQSPSVLLLDEPTNGVDPISRREFWDLLYRLNAERILIILATAYMDEAERCNQVHLLSAGKLIATGEPRALLKQEGARNFDALFIKRAQEGVG